MKGWLLMAPAKAWRICSRSDGRAQGMLRLCGRSFDDLWADRCFTQAAVLWEI